MKQAACFYSLHPLACLSMLLSSLSLGDLNALSPVKFLSFLLYFIFYPEAEIALLHLTLYTEIEASVRRLSQDI